VFPLRLNRPIAPLLFLITIYYPGNQFRLKPFLLDLQVAGLSITIIVAESLTMFCLVSGPILLHNNTHTVPGYLVDWYGER
jgi:hypothetical protein